LVLVLSFIRFRILQQENITPSCTACGTLNVGWASGVASSCKNDRPTPLPSSHNNSGDTFAGPNLSRGGQLRKPKELR